MLRAVGGPLRWLATAAGMAAAVVRQGLRPKSWRRPARAEFLRFMELAGVQNLPAVVVAGVLVGISLVAQGMYWLNQLGEEELVFTVIAVIMIREIAPLVVGLLALGRGGLLILDELSELRRDGQCRALDAQGIDPFLTLVMPRVLALALSVFCLSMILIVVAFTSGYLTASLLGAARRTPIEFVAQTFATIGNAGYAVLPLKSLGIGFAIGIVCCLTALEQPQEPGAERALMPVGFMRSVLAVFLVSGLVSVL
ncbi:MAG TPA: ABC transporter permease [Geminicoccaceae bacterium]|nr:ABC transporter permease [Geminicoccaceae bacterium]